MIVTICDGERPIGEYIDSSDDEPLCECRKADRNPQIVMAGQRFSHYKCEYCGREMESITPEESEILEGQMA